MSNKNLEIKKTIQNAGLKATNQRIFLMDFILASKRPFCVDDAFAKLKSKKIDKVTVYRMIKMFLEHKILRSVDLRKNAEYFEKNKDHHHHIVCNCCGLIEDVSSCEVESVAKKAIKKSKKFSIINDHSFELFGTCKICIKK